MKRLKFHRAIVAIAMMLIGQLPSLAHDFEVDGIFYDKLNSSEVAVTYKGYSYSSYSNEYAGDAVIPSSVDYNGTTYSVTSIGDHAFWHCSSLTSIEIPNSVTSIGDKAFEYCYNLTSIEIPNSVTSIGYWAFWVCTSLTSIQIPNSVTSIGDFAFSDCSSLTSIEIPNSVTSIGYSAFSWCTSLTSIEIPNSVTSIGVSAFSWCTSLTSIEIPNSVTSIGYTAFCGCSSLTSIKIPNSVTSIGDSAFAYCSSLTSIEIPNSVTSIGDSAFAYCSSLTGIEIPNSVTSIGGAAFSWCSSLTGIEIPNSVTSIGEYAFNECSSLTSIEIPNSITSIGDFAFSDCSSLTSIEIPNSVTSIGDKAFEYCYDLTSIEIGNGVTSIGDLAFSSCSSLTSIVVDSGNTIYDSRNGCNAIIETASNTLIVGCQNTIIPNSVTSIGELAFCYCSSLTSIEIPDSVTSIGYGAFCVCSNLTSIQIPNSVTSIGDDAFYGCSSLTKITCFATNPPTIKSNTFNSYSAELYVPAGCISAYQSANFWKKFNIKEIPTLSTSIALNKTSASLKATETITLIATVLPENATDKSVTWKSSNEAVATVDANGLVTAVAVGDAVITATTTDGSNLSASCKVTVTSTLATSITLNHTEYDMVEKAEFQLTATILPEMTTNKSVVWSSSDAWVAPVDENGLVRAYSIGEAVITATTIDGSNLSASCKVTVVSSLAQSITLDKMEVSLEATETAALVATVLPKLASNKSVEWSSSNEAIAVVDENGVVTAISIGEAVITATTADGSNLSASCKVSVIPTLAVSIELDKTQVSNEEKTYIQLTATILPKHTTNKEVAWSSSKKVIATVDETGLVFVKSVGEVVITATTTDGSNLSASCKIIVMPTLAESITLDKTSATLKATETLTLKATIAPATTTDNSVTWTSSNEAVATVDANGKVTAVAVGEATITATTADGSNLSASCKIIVKPTLATSITLDYSEYEIVEKSDFQLVATVLPELTTNKGVVWSSSDMWVASVDENGLVRAYSVGEAIITATTVDGSNLSASCKVTVVSSLAQSITLDKTEVSLKATETATLVATVLPETTSNKSVEWKSSNKAVASVNNEGEVTAIAVGEATITATTADGSNLSASCTVTVVPTLAESIALDKTEISLEATESATLIVTVLSELTTDKSVKWSSSDETVAVVDENGVVTAIAVGEAIITATTADGSNLSATCKVTVIPTLAVSIELDQTEASVEEKSDLQLTAIILPEHATNKEVAWSSSDKWVATVDNTGLVTIHSAGEVIITATTTDGTNLSATCRINVYSGIDGVNGDDVIVATIGDNIVVKNAPLGSNVRVYAADGSIISSEIATDGDVVIEAPVKGIYIVAIDGKSFKVMVK